MDPVPGHRHDREQDEQPRTATEEAMTKIAYALEAAVKDYERLSLFSLRKRFYMQGVIKSLSLVFELLHTLHHKYDNERGDLN